MTKVFVVLLTAGALHAADLPPGPAKPTVERVCGTCHAVDIVTGRKLSKDGWEKIIADMAEKGASATDAEFDQIVAYLAKNFPDNGVNVNTASADVLAKTLEVPDDVAAAIVKYRNDKGDFKSAEDLKKVPGLDAKKVDDKKSLLKF